MITAPVRYLRNFLIPLVVILFVGSTNPWALASALVVLVSFFVSGLVTYQTFRYRVGAERLEIRQGLISRSRRTIPLERIRGVDVTSTLLHRILGLAVVRIEAASGRGESEEGKLDAVSRREADRLRQVLLRRKEELRERKAGEDPSSPTGDTEGTEGAVRASGTGAGGPHSDALEVPAATDASSGAETTVSRGTGTNGADRTYFTMPRRWYLYGAVTLGYLLTPFVALAALLGVVAQAIGQVEVDIRREDAEGALEWLSQVAEIPLAWIVSGVLLGLAVLMPTFAVVAYAINHWAFSLTQREQSLVTSRGLFTRHSVTLERRRIRGYELIDTPLERLVRAVQLRAIVTGLGDVSTRAVLLPLGNRPRVMDVVDRALGSFRSTLRAHPRAALARRLFRAVAPWLVVAVVALATRYDTVAVLALVLAVVNVPLGWDRYRSLGHGYDGDHVSVRSGSLRRRHAVVHRQAVIGWRWNQTIFQRRVGLATLTATVGAGTGGYSAIDAAMEDSVRFADTVSPATVRPFIEVDEPDTPPGPRLDGGLGA
ncbi:PH domain-containing protein [Spiractinospora alimapuensis]|nr:PH domain-containing protein [Spiractinospora alimapuensis]